MTYKQLLNELSNFPAERLDEEVSIFDNDTCEFLEFESFEQLWTEQFVIIVKEYKDNE